MKLFVEKDKITKNIFQEESLKNLLQIGHRKKNKTAVFEFSKNFVARFKHRKILQKYLKFKI